MFYTFVNFPDLYIYISRIVYMLVLLHVISKEVINMISNIVMQLIRSLLSVTASKYPYCAHVKSMFIRLDNYNLHSTRYEHVRNWIDHSNQYSKHQYRKTVENIVETTHEPNHLWADRLLKI